MGHTTYLVLHLVRMVMHLRLDEFRKNAWIMIVHVVIRLLDLHATSNDSVFLVKSSLIELLLVHSIALRWGRERGVLH